VRRRTPSLACLVFSALAFATGCSVSNAPSEDVDTDEGALNAACYAFSFDREGLRTRLAAHDRELDWHLDRIERAAGWNFSPYSAAAEREHLGLYLDDAEETELKANIDALRARVAAIPALADDVATLDKLKTDIDRLNQHGKTLTRTGFRCLTNDARVRVLQTPVFTEEELYDSSLSQLAPDVRQRLEAAALDRANVWPDTILEGDYSQTGDAVLSSVTVYKRGTRPYAYRVHIAAEAIYTGDCEYDEAAESWSDDCSTGHISEDAYFTFELEEIHLGDGPSFDD
jgi:hypothetical protein